MTPVDPGYRYLNLDGQWLDFKLHGLEKHADGSMTLAAVPAIAGPPPDLSKVPEPDCASGLAVDGAGGIYYTVPGVDSVWRVDHCDGSIAVIPCLDLNSPRGLAVHPQRQALMICDCGNHRVLVYNMVNWQLLEVRKGFQSPIAIAVDGDGNSYISDSGNKSVKKFTPSGDPDEKFNSTVTGAQLIQDPTAVAVSGGRLFVLDAALLDVLVFDATGHPVPGLDVMWEDLERPCGLAVTSDSVYVGDNAMRRVLRYVNAYGFPFVGEALGFEGPAAALAIGVNGEVLVNTGQAIGPIPLTIGAGYAKEGFFWSGPISPGGSKVAWHSLHAELSDEFDGVHVQLFVFAGPKPPAVDPAGADPFPSPWKAAPEGTTDVFIGGDPTASISIGGRLSGDGASSPKLNQLKARFNQLTYLPYLPGVYREPSPAGDFLPRLLALFESFNAATEDSIARLPELFDPDSISAEFLPWLATWLAVDIDQTWNAAMQRQAIAGAYQRYSKRGTLAGIRETIAFETGAAVTITEPIQSMSWWVLPAAADPCSPSTDDESSDAGAMLGFNTMLASSAPQGAVIGGTAILDRSRITVPGDLGTPLFDEAAHRFSVILPPRPGGANVSAAVAGVVDREKPAHTTYHLCVLEPRMRVGFQARVGVDTIVGRSGVLGRLDETSLADGLRLGSQSHQRIGVQCRLGDGVRL
jgi:phage tail-like protein